MGIRFLFALFIFLVLGTPQEGFAAAAEKSPTEIVVGKPTVGDSGNQVDLALEPARMGKLEAILSEPTSGRTLKSTLEPVPKNFWLLVDVSSLCRAHKVDQYANALVRSFRTDFSKKGFVSVLAYSNSSLEIYANQRAAAELEDIQMDCENKGLSSGLDKPLQHLLKQKSASDLPVEAWVLTSGNVGLTSETIGLLKSRKANLRVMLYNTVLEKEIAPLVEKMKGALGTDHVDFSARAIEEDLSYLPARALTLKFETPTPLEGKKATLQLKLTANRQEIAKTSFLVSFRQDLQSLWLRRMAAILGAIFLTVVGGYLTYRLVRYYRSPQCPECKRLVKRPARQCLFCRKAEAAFLVGKAFPWDKRRAHWDSVFPLDSRVTVLGNHRKSAVPLVGPLKRGRATYARIVKEDLGGGRWSYHLVPASAPQELPLCLNGQPLTAARFLGQGDTLTVGPMEFTFVFGKRSEKNESSFKSNG